VIKTVITTLVHVNYTLVLSKLKTIGEMIGAHHNSVTLPVSLILKTATNVKESNNVKTSKSKLNKSLPSIHLLMI
jgi:hypothetical protein